MVNLDTVWIRVPVYVGQLDELGERDDGIIEGMGGVKKSFNLSIDRVILDQQNSTIPDPADVDRLADRIKRQGQPRPVSVRWDRAQRAWVVMPGGERVFQACSKAGRRSIQCRLIVTRMDAPPSADALSSTADLYFEMPNTGIVDRRGKQRLLRPGERLGVKLLTGNEQKRLVVSSAAVLYDIHGTAWVYQKSAEGVYRRRRVLVRYTTGELAVLDRGPPLGTVVVVDGTAELFGTEFGAGK